MADIQGGLAAVTEEEEVYGPPSPGIAPEEIVARTTGGPDPGQSLTQMILQGKESAIERLRATRENLADRRTKNAQREKQDKWLAIAQSMLTPTRTGGFGESVGMAAGAVRDVSSQGADTRAGFAAEEAQITADEIAAEGDALNQLIALDKQGRTKFTQTTVGGPEAAVHPEDTKNSPANQRMVLVQAYQDPSLPGPEGIRTVFLKGDDGELILSVERNDPRRMAEIERAKERAGAEEQRSQFQIGDALIAKGSMVDIQRAMAILEQIDPGRITTSGINALKNRIANILGIDFGDTADLTELQMIIAENYMERLADLKGASSDTDLREMKSISAGIGQNATANYRQLVRMRAVYNRIIKRGIREAHQRGNSDYVYDLWDGYDSEIPVLPKGSKGQKAYDELEVGQMYYEDYGGAAFTKRAPAEEEE
jgi:hypothetical protein